MIKTAKHTYEVRTSMLDVTSLARADTSWRVVDQKGHVHCYYDGDKPATSYDPRTAYTTPTLRFVRTGWGHWPDGGRYAIGHYVCRRCRERVEDPRKTADDCQQFIPGLQRYYLDGRTVSKEEFEAAAREEGFLL